MGLNIAEKIIKDHLVSGKMEPGAEIALRIDQTLTQDATGTMAYLEFESMGIDRVKTKRSVAYVDHNTLQSGFENADDHRYIQSVAKKHGIWFSRPGNGICHQVHLERFGIPGMTLVGSDSHTPTAGGLGAMDVAAAMGGLPYYINMPAVIKVELKGALRPFVSAKDIALELLRILGVKGGVGKIIEWGGAGIAGLTVPQRATITNMGAELGATSSVFPSDGQTQAFLKAQGREQDYQPLAPDGDAAYEQVIEIDLDRLEPLAACPHMPDNVRPVRELSELKVDQVCIGSCTNSSLRDMLTAAAMLKGHTISPDVSMSVSPGSRQVLTMLSDCGALSDILASGARLLECACGPCIGMGFSPNSGGVSLRTFNRNFEGRSGTKDAQVYLVSPETAVASALTGHITDPATLEAAAVEVLRGPNIREFPKGAPLTDEISAALTLKVGDNITTDHIMPAGAKILPYRSNIPKMSEFCFTVCDEHFPERAKRAGQSIIVGGLNYGQGSSREHAALVPLYLGVRAVVAKSFARIHEANLINAGILPLRFKNESDYDRLTQGDSLRVSGIYQGLAAGHMLLHTPAGDVELVCDFTARQQRILLSGGLLQVKGE